MQLCEQDCTLSPSGAPDRQESDLGRAVEPGGDVDGPEAGVGIELKITDPIKAGEVFAAELREKQRRQEGEPDLTSVSMSGELKVDGIACNAVGKIRLMRQQDEWLRCRNFLDGSGQIRRAVEDIVNASEPESAAVSFDCDGFIIQNMNAILLQGRRDVLGIGSGIVISQDGPQSMRRAKLFQQFGTGFGGRGGIAHPTYAWVRDKVAGQDDEVGMEVVDFANRMPDGMNRKIRIVMKVAEQRDLESVEPRGPAAEINVFANDSREIGCDQNRVCSNSANSGGYCPLQKLPAVKRSMD